MVSVGMRIQQAGTTTAPVVVLLHGSGRAARMWDPNVGSTAMAAAVLRLASFNPKMRATVEGDTEPLLESLLGKKGVRHG